MKSRGLSVLFFLQQLWQSTKNKFSSCAMRAIDNTRILRFACATGCLFFEGLPVVSSSPHMSSLRSLIFKIDFRNVHDWSYTLSEPQLERSPSSGYSSQDCVFLWKNDGIFTSLCCYRKQKKLWRSFVALCCCYCCSRWNYAVSTWMLKRQIFLASLVVLNFILGYCVAFYTEVIGLVSAVIYLVLQLVIIVYITVCFLFAANFALYHSTN